MNKWLNPVYFYRKRDRIIPLLVNAVCFPLRQMRRRLAIKGSPVTKNDRKLCELEGRHKDKMCVVVGNGPSLTMGDLDKIHEKNVISFAFNKIYLAFRETQFRPSYYMVEDPLVARNIKDEIFKLGYFFKLFPHDFKYFLKEVPNSLFYYLNWADFYPGRPKSTCNPFALHWGASVTFTALQFAIYFGCNPIYLIGVDFFFIESERAGHLEENILISDGERNHFHPHYRKAGEKWYAPRLNHQRQAFEAVRLYCEANGIQIVNISRRSCLDVFPRGDFDEIFA